MKPFVILINGLLMYQPGALTPLAGLAGQLEAAGWEVCIDNHFNTSCYHPKPDLIIGHSQGGATALRLAAERKPKMVITFDAVRMTPCPSGVRCINFKTPGYPLVPRAENIPVVAEHITMVHLSELKQKVLSYGRLIQDASNRTLNDSRTTRMELPSTNHTARILPRAGLPALPNERATSDHPTREPNTSPSWPPLERWPDDSFGELILSLEDQCFLLSFPNPDVCP